MTLYDFYESMNENLIIIENAEDYFMIRAAAAYICGDICFLEKAIHDGKITFEEKKLKNEATRLTLKLTSACLITLQYYGERMFKCIPVLLLHARNLVLFLEAHAEEE